MADIDQFAHKYTSLLDQCVGLSGETSQYFSDYKASYLAATLANNGEKKKILDFGLLPAAVTKYFPDAIQHGSDVSQASLDSVDPRLARSGRFNSDLLCLDRGYDAIVMSVVLHHIPLPKQDQIFREVANRLRPGGKLFVFEHNPVNPITRWVLNQCPFRRNTVLLKPKKVIAYLRASRLRFVGHDYLVFLPRLLSLCRPRERYLLWCPLEAQYVITGATIQ